MRISSLVLSSIVALAGCGGKVVEETDELELPPAKVSEPVNEAPHPVADPFHAGDDWHGT